MAPAPLVLSAVQLVRSLLLLAVGSEVSVACCNASAVLVHLFVTDDLTATQAVRV